MTRALQNYNGSDGLACPILESCGDTSVLNPYTRASHLSHEHEQRLDSKFSGRKCTIDKK